MDYKVTVYSKPNCVMCTATYRKLDKHGITHRIFDISEDSEAATVALSFGHSSAPVVVVEYGDGTLDSWGGYSDAKLNLLAQTGTTLA